jgi:lipooligosaccharide transport system permease protein
LRVVEREARVFRRLWRGSVFTGLVSPILYLAAMGVGLGGLVDAGSGHLEGVNYLAFVTPGLLAASAMQGAAGESLWPVMAGTKWSRFFHGVVATPVRPSDLYVGFVLWTAVRAAIFSTGFLAVGAVLGGVPSPWGALALPAAVLGATAFAAPLTAFSATQDIDLAFPLIMRLGVIPLFLFSGTFFPVSQLPGWLQPVAALSPLWHAVQLCRSATTGTFRPGPALVHVAVLVAFIAAGAAWGVRTFTRRLSA